VSFIAVLIIFGPAIVIAVFGVEAIQCLQPRPWGELGWLALASTIVWLVYVGLYQHEEPCAGFRRSGCPTVYGYPAPLPDEHAAGWMLLIVGGFVVPAVWAGWRRLVPSRAVGLALCVGPIALAFWTTPRGDNDGLWTLIFVMLPILGLLAIVVARITRALGRRFGAA
jgi:hypothetical protein